MEPQLAAERAAREKARLDSIAKADAAATAEKQERLFSSCGSRAQTTGRIGPPESGAGFH